MGTMNFKELQIKEQIKRAIEEMGFEAATPIQSQAIPVILEGKDVIGQAQTGTGKTATFAIPVLDGIDPKDKSTQALILCPTRELAIQVAEEVKKLSKYLHGVKSLPIYGGQEITKQIRSLKGGVQIIIGTPGRVMDHMRRHTIKLQDIKKIVLDEADEMLNMGFLDDIETILLETPATRQTVMFSATMSKEIQGIATRFQKSPEIIKVVKKELTVPNIEQLYFEVKQKSKPEVLCRLLDMYNPKLSLVFCNTKRQVDETVAMLQGRGYFADGLHGDLKQAQRDKVMKGFRSGKTEILVATDVAARGIDVDDVEIVFNYDVPQDDEYYVHRIGRTGRAGRLGKSFTFVVGKEIYKLRDIQRYSNTKIKSQPIPSANDVEGIKMTSLMEKVTQIAKNEDLKKYIDVINKTIDEEDVSVNEIAAAFMLMTLGIEEVENIEEEEFIEESRTSEGMVRLFMNIGKKHNVKPGDILGCIAGESGIPGKLVGVIDMYDKYSFVEVPRDYAKQVVQTMKDAKIRGKAVNIEPAGKKN